MFGRIFGRFTGPNHEEIIKKILEESLEKFEGIPRKIPAKIRRKSFVSVPREIPVKKFAWIFKDIGMVEENLAILLEEFLEKFLKDALGAYISFA